MGERAGALRCCTGQRRPVGPHPERDCRQPASADYHPGPTALRRPRVGFCGFKWSIGLQKSTHHLAGRLLLSLLVGTMAGALPVVFSAEAVPGFRFSASQAEEAPRQAETAPPSPSKQAQAPSEGARSEHCALKWLRSYASAVAVAKKQNKLVIATSTQTGASGAWRWTSRPFTPLSCKSMEGG